MPKIPATKVVPAQASRAPVEQEGVRPEGPSRHTDDLVRRVDELRRTFQTASALHLLNDVLMGQPEPTDALAVAHARVLLARHRPDDAAGVLRRAYELNGGTADVSAWLIASLSRGHHYVAATNLAAEASQIHPTSALVRISTGRLLIDQYRFEESVPYFQEAYTLDRDDPRALRWLLHGLRQTRRFDEVDTVATTIGLTADPPRIEYARSLLDRYQFKRALAELDLVAATPAEVAALQVRLEALRGLRRLAEAERLAHDAIGEREDDPRPWLELGHVFHEGHRHEDALVAFERAHTIDPSSADALEWRTTELRRLRRWDDAERSAHDAIARRPDAPLLYVELSYLHEDQHLFERAMAAVEQALAIDPRLVPALSQRIDVLRQLRRLDHAEQAALQAIDVRPDSTVLRLALGYVYDEQRDCERALTAAEQALAIDPRYVWAITGRITQLRQLRRFSTHGTNRPSAGEFSAYGGYGVSKKPNRPRARQPTPGPTPRPRTSISATSTTSSATANVP
ncbi:tetratricopeptide repeat protein [Micromonospora parva]|uniref:tetratricopeptide repeat protein n=1 Tax=Micromonospora parva TaxID=1464048 RepID=UPI0009DEB9FF|nr:tetratricopeptide repeat protein [Micromonospora parva]